MSFGRRARAILLIPLALAHLSGASGCAARAFARPAGPATPAPDAMAIWTAATRACRTVREFRASGQMSARVGGQRIPRVGLGLAVDAMGSLAVEASAAGQLIFKLAGTADRATLVMPDGNRVVRGPADAILDALVGARLEPTRLLAVLSGCVSRTPAFDHAERYGDLTKAVTSDGDVYVGRRNGVWQARAGFFDGLVVEYGEFRGDWPHHLSIVSEPGRSPAVSISIDLDGPSINPPAVPEVFTVNVPSDAAPMSVDELRATGPLGDRNGGR